MSSPFRGLRPFYSSSPCPSVIVLTRVLQPYPLTLEPPPRAPNYSRLISCPFINTLFLPLNPSSLFSDPQALSPFLPMPLFPILFSFSCFCQFSLGYAWCNYSSRLSFSFPLSFFTFFLSFFSYNSRTFWLSVSFPFAHFALLSLHPTSSSSFFPTLFLHPSFFPSSSWEIGRQRGREGAKEAEMKIWG